MTATSKKRKNKMEEKKKESVNIAVIRIKGRVRIGEPIERTLRMLNIHRVNYCTVIKDNPSNRGMLAKVKDFVTWGLIDETTFKELQQKKEEKTKKKGKEVTKPFYRLHPPRGGFERKGTKMAFNVAAEFRDAIQVD